MNEQESIFDTAFEEHLYTRRRQLLPLVVKIYVWFFIVIGSLCVFGGFLPLVNLLLGVTGSISDLDSLVYALSRLFVCFAVGSLFLLISVSLWREAKWAIRINWGLAVLLIVFLITDLLDFTTGVVKVDWTMFIPILFFLPFWILLYRIQQRWEQLIQTKK